MARRILAAALLVGLISLALTGIISTGVAEKYLLKQLEDDLASNARLMERVVADYMSVSGKTVAWEDLAKEMGKDIGARVTIIDEQGTVLGDSDADAAKLESHLGRPEIQAAYRGETGKSYRYSTSLGMEMLYLAVPVSVDQKVMGVVRVALPLVEVEQFSRSLWQSMLPAGIVGLLVAIIASYVAAMKLAKPIGEVALAAREIARGQYHRRLPVRKGPAEIRFLAEAFNQMTDKLAKMIGQLTERKHRLETVLASMDDSLIAVDCDGRVMMFNPPAAELFQVAEKEAVKRHLLEVVRHEGLYQVISEVLNRGQVLRREISMFLPEERIFRVHATPIIGDELSGAVAVLRDMTELKQTEQIRTEFVANVSHELKTPLTSISGYVETLLDGAYQDEAVNLRFLKVIQRETNRLTRLIEDLLLLSRVESVKGQLVPVPVDLSGTIDKVVNLLSAGLAGKKQQLVKALPHALPKVKATEDHLEQILLNLLDNAIKYSPEASTITVKAWEEEQNVAFAVIDEGCGIPPEALPRIFERFYRVDKARTREIPGTGLGLSLVKHLVDGLEGTVEVSSVPEKGSRFTVRLPRA